MPTAAVGYKSWGKKRHELPTSTKSEWRCQFRLRQSELGRTVPNTVIKVHRHSLQASAGWYHSVVSYVTQSFDFWLLSTAMFAAISMWSPRSPVALKSRDTWQNVNESERFHMKFVDYDLLALSHSSLVCTQRLPLAGSCRAAYDQIYHKRHDLS